LVPAKLGFRGREERRTYSPGERRNRWRPETRKSETFLKIVLGCSKKVTFRGETGDQVKWKRDSRTKGSPDRIRAKNRASCAIAFGAGRKVLVKF